MNQFAGMRADDVGSDDLNLSSGANDLRKAFSLLFGVRSIIIRELSSVNVNIERTCCLSLIIIRKAPMILTCLDPIDCRCKASSSTVQTQRRFDVQNWIGSRKSLLRLYH